MNFNVFGMRDALEFIKMYGLQWHALPFNINELIDGLNVELEHGLINPKTNITNNDLLMTGKIAMAHLLEDPEYYTKLKVMEGGAEVNYQKDREKNFLASKPYPQTYPNVIKKNIQLLSFGPSDKITPFGSYIFRIQQFPGDVDCLEEFNFGTNAQQLITAFTARLKEVVRNIIKNKIHYITDFKMGLDNRFDIDLGKVENNVFTPNTQEILRKTNVLYRSQLLNNDEVKQIREVLSKNNLDANDYDIIHDIFRQHRVLRWTPQEILKGKKILPGGIPMTIQQALTFQTHVKIDMITLINGRFIEVTNFLFLVFNVPGRDSWILNFGEANNKKFFKERIDSLVNEVEKLFYSKMFYSPFKGIKRLWTLSRNRGDKQMINKLANFVSSDISLLYQIRSEIETMVLILMHGKSPLATINNALQDIKMRLNYVLEFNNEQLKQFAAQIDNIINDKYNKVSLMNNFSKEIKKVIAEYTISWLKQNNLWPIPSNYLPKVLKYQHDNNKLNTNTILNIQETLRREKEKKKEKQKLQEQEQIKQQELRLKQEFDRDLEEAIEQDSFMGLPTVMPNNYTSQIYSQEFINKNLRNKNNQDSFVGLPTVMPSNYESQIYSQEFINKKMKQLDKNKKLKDEYDKQMRILNKNIDIMISKKKDFYNALYPMFGQKSTDLVNQRINEFENMYSIFDRDYDYTNIDNINKLKKINAKLKKNITEIQKGSGGNMIDFITATGGI